MIAQLTAGNKVKFQYVDRKEDFTQWPSSRTNYVIDEYEGTVIAIRDTDTEQGRIALKTVVTKPAIERSRYLLTVQLSDNKIKSFYDGRIINVQKINKSFLRRTLDKLTGK